MRIKILFLLIAMSVLVSCSEEHVASLSEINAPQKSTGKLIQNEFADKFQIEKFDSYTLISISGKSEKKEQYILYKEESALADLPSYGTKIKVPVENIVSLSCVYTRAFFELDYMHAVKAVDQVRHHYLPEVWKAFEEGEIQEISTDNQMNIERLMELSPDAIFSYHSDNGNDIYSKLSKAGIPVVFCTAFLEDHPLGKAEWIKLFAQFVGKEKEAEALFSKISQDYLNLKDRLKIPNVKQKTVFCNAPYSDKWYLPKADSFTARFFKDAGLNYIWKDAKGIGNQPLSIEVILDRALDADIWLNAGAYLSYDELLKIDSRLGNFKAFKENNVFNTLKKTRSNFGNDYWEMGSLHPDLILKDLVSIAYPELLPDHETVFYQSLK